MPLKIYQSQLSINKGETPQISKLSVPMEYVSKVKEGADAFGNVIKEWKSDQEKTINESRSTDIIIEGKKQIQKVLSNSANSSDYDGMELQLKQAFDKIDVTKENKGVRDLVNSWKNEYKKLAAGAIFKNVASNVAQDAQDTQKKKLLGWAVETGSNDPMIRAAADKKIENYFLDKNNEQYFGKDFSKVENQISLLKSKLQKSFDVKNNPLGVLLDREAILKQFGKEDGQLILDKAANVLASKNALNRNYIINKEQSTISQQIYNFTDIAQRINASKNDLSNTELLNKVPTLDNIYDYYRNNSINEAQYNSLLKLYNQDNAISNENMFNLVSNQIAVAKTVNEISDFQNYANSAKEVLGNLNLEDLTTFNQVISQIKRNPDNHKEFRDFEYQLKVNMGDLQGAATLIFGKGGITPDDKLRTNEALKMFRKKFGETGNAEQAYLDTIKNFTKNIPTLSSPSFQPLHYKFTDLEKQVNDAAKKGQNAFDIARNEIAQKHKKGQINFEDLKTDLRNLDLMEDFYNIRKNVLPANEVFSSKSSGLDFKSIQKDLKK